jgi:hypothetical protein
MSSGHRPRRSGTSEYIPVETPTRPGGPYGSGSGSGGSAGEQPNKGSGGGGGGGKSPSTPNKVEGKGVLPYASELFGVYQPLIGWKSTLSKERLGIALANRTLAAAKALEQIPDPDIPTPRIVAPHFVNRTKSKVGDEIVHFLNNPQSRRTDSDDGGADSVTSKPDIVSFLKKKRDSQFFKLTKNVLKTLDDGEDRASAVALRREAAMATILHDLAATQPNIVQQLFTPSLTRLDRIRAGMKLFTDDSPSAKAFLSPIGILHLFKEYFFQIGTFLGEPVGHVWLAPGSSLELVEVQTRRQVIEKIVEESTETTFKNEVDTTTKDEIADAVKSENSNDTKLGATVSGGGGMGVWHASASATFSMDSSRKQAQEQTHTKMREQSSKLSNEIKQNYKTTFRTLTETTDTASRRYVLQNTTPKLVSYELARKMRKVAVQVQDLGRRLCWQLYVDNPGDPLGVGDFVYATDSALDSSVKRPEHQAYPANIEKTFSTAFPYIQTKGGDDDTEDTYTTKNGNPDIGLFNPKVGSDNEIKFRNTFKCPPTPAGFVLKSLSSIDFHGASVQWDPNIDLDVTQEQFSIRLTAANFNSQRQMPFDVTLVYEPTPALKSSIDAVNAAADKTYSDSVAAENETKFFDTLRTRLKLVSRVQTRSQTDLREEERNLIYRTVISRLYGKETGWDNEDYHVASEMIRYFFDIDSMLYFVAPDWWKPR